MPKRTVNDIPILLRPFYLTISFLIAIAFYLQQNFLRLICRIEYVGKDHIDATPNRIFCIWHENLPLFFMTHNYFRDPNIWLTFPLWYMKPIHYLKKMIGIKELAFGASGHDGKKALEKVLTRLKEGWSTFLTPDGPKGPLKQMKNGVLLMSKETNTPVIPISFHLSKEWRIPSWDRKRYPWPLSKLTVIYGAPVYVNDENIDVARKQISNGMD